MSSFSERFKRARERAGLSVADIAARCGVSGQAVYNWENGSAPRSADRMKKLADVLGVPQSWLAFGQGELPPSPVHSFSPGDTPPEGFVAIPEYKVTFAAGSENGEPTWEETHETEETWYRSSFFKRHGIDPRRCRRVRVVGDSMEPFLFAGDRVLIEEEPDPSSVAIEDGAVYVINLEGDCRIKRLARIKGGIRVISDNAEKYPPEDYVGDEADRIRIYGRVYEVSRMI